LKFARNCDAFRCGGAGRKQARAQASDVIEDGAYKSSHWVEPYSLAIKTCKPKSFCRCRHPLGGGFQLKVNPQQAAN
jgi:hypothetical protein